MLPFNLFALYPAAIFAELLSSPAGLHPTLPHKPRRTARMSADEDNDCPAELADRLGAHA